MKAVAIVRAISHVAAFLIKHSTALFLVVRFKFITPDALDARERGFTRTCTLTWSECNKKIRTLSLIFLGQKM